MKHPEAHELLDNCFLDKFEWVKWYNQRLKELNFKKELKCIEGYWKYE